MSGQGYFAQSQTVSKYTAKQYKEEVLSNAGGYVCMTEPEFRCGSNTRPGACREMRLKESVVVASPPGHKASAPSLH